MKNEKEKQTTSDSRMLAILAVDTAACGSVAILSENPLVKKINAIAAAIYAACIFLQIFTMRKKFAERLVSEC